MNEAPPCVRVRVRVRLGLCEAAKTCCACMAPPRGLVSSEHALMCGSGGREDSRSCALIRSCVCTYFDWSLAATTLVTAHCTDFDWSLAAHHLGNSTLHIF